MTFPRRSLRNGLLGSAFALTAALAITLTGCTGPSPAPTPTTSSTAKDVQGLPSGVQQATSVPTAVPNTPALRKNVTIKKCEEAAGGWKAEGVAANPGKDAKTYTITVFFTTDHGTVLGTGDTKVKVEPGKTEDWTVNAKLTPTPNIQCVLRGVG